MALPFSVVKVYRYVSDEERTVAGLLTSGPFVFVFVDPYGLKRKKEQTVNKLRWEVLSVIDLRFPGTSGSVNGYYS